MAGATQEPAAKLGAAPLDEPVENLNPDTLSSFRAVPERAALAEQLGPLNDLPGHWIGNGFNLIARPDRQQNNDIFLQLSLTKETLDFSTIGSPIPNRGSEQKDIFLRGIHYLQQITDAKTNGALHIEPGIWVTVPATQAPKAGETVTRLATIPHGDAVCAPGTASTIKGKPKIDPVNTVPFGVGESTPGPKAKNEFPEYDLSKANQFRTAPGLLGGITQDMVDDPTVKLRHDLHGQTITETTVLKITTHKGGGVSNIPFVTENADAQFVNSIFWIEKVQGPHGDFVQLQYVQTVLLVFLGLNWPHVSVATLQKTF